MSKPACRGGDAARRSVCQPGRCSDTAGDKRWCAHADIGLRRVRTIWHEAAGHPLPGSQDQADRGPHLQSAVSAYSSFATSLTLMQE
jgi:hypothetical protein